MKNYISTRNGQKPIGFYEAIVQGIGDDGLRLGFKDRLHQPYRGHLIKGYDEIMERLDNDPMVLGSYLSGAGPSLIALIKAEDTMGVVRIKEELGSLLDGWQVLKLELDTKGYTCDFE